MLGDKPCEGRRVRFRWYRSAELLDVRIRRALEALKAARGGQLESERVTVIGYSQGADRAERLASRFPDRYPRVLLGSPPQAPDIMHFVEGQAIALVAGAREGNDARRDGVEMFREAGLPAVFLSLPEAYHGQYGPEGERVMDEALTWLFDQVPASSQIR